MKKAPLSSISVTLHETDRGRAAMGFHPMLYIKPKICAANLPIESHFRGKCQAVSSTTANSVTDEVY